MPTGGGITAKMGSVRLRGVQQPGLADLGTPPKIQTLDAEIAAAEDEIKGVMGDEETLLAGAFKVDWKPVITCRIDTAALKKMMPEIAERFMKQTTTRRFCVR